MAAFPAMTMSTILCCMCGCEIEQNPANMCLPCIREHVDITEGINKSLTIHSCRSCGRFLCPPWQTVSLESKELMATCLRKIPGLSKVKLIDAVWIWTEPHSMRLKIKITIQKEVMNGAVLQQAAIVEFTIRNQQCNHCQASYAQGAWQAVVQIRQRVSHKRTFYFLEQLLLKHNAHSECINIVTFRDGMDFYFTEKQNALRFTDFLSSHVPTRSKYSRKLLSADHKSNEGKFKHNFIVEIVPLCKDDLVILPKALAKNLSDISPLVLVKAVSAGVHVVDPLTGERQEIDVEKYWRHEFEPAMSSRSLIKFIVLSVQPFLSAPRPSAKKRGADRKIRLAECVVARERDFGVTDIQFTCVTHLGHLLREGDTVLGFDLTSAAWSLEEGAGDEIKSGLPDIILVRKVYKTKGERKWELKMLQVDERKEMTSREQEAADEDYENFLQEVEADKEMRSAINVYKSKRGSAKKTAAAAAAAAKAASTQLKKKRAASSRGVASRDTSDTHMDGDDEGSDSDNDGDEDDLDDEQIRLDELLDELTLASGLVDSSDALAAGAAGGGEVGVLDPQRLGGDVLVPQLLTSAEAAAVPAISIGTSGFDVADFDSSKFKFT